MRKLKFLAIIFLMMAALSCEKEEDITGDSGLKIINDCTTSVKVYFDDSYIGRVSSDESETWDVPSGTHTVKATSSFYDDWEQTLTFYVGVTKVVRLEIEYGFKSIRQVPEYQE